MAATTRGSERRSARVGGAAVGVAPSPGATGEGAPGKGEAGTEVVGVGDTLTGSVDDGVGADPSEPRGAPAEQHGEARSGGDDVHAHGGSLPEPPSHPPVPPAGGSPGGGHRPAVLCHLQLTGDALARATTGRR